MDLQKIQEEVARIWRTDSSYTEAFLDADGRMPHLSFTHALIHATKAAGKLAAVVDDLDHSGEANLDFERFLADLVICAARMANLTSYLPNSVGPADLDKAVACRLEVISQRKETQR